MKHKKQVGQVRKKLKKHAFTSLAYFVAALLALLGSLMARGYVSADETITVMGRVGDVIVGPTTVAEDEDDDEDSDEDSVSDVAAKPVVSIQPSTEGGAAFSYITDPVTGKSILQFTSDKPSFQGETNIKDALIKFAFQYGQFNFHVSTHADAAGKWRWHSQESFPNGLYHVDITAENPRTVDIQAFLNSTGAIAQGARVLGIQTIASMDFLVNSDKKVPDWEDAYQANDSSALFDVIVTIPETFQTIAPGDELVAKIKLINFGTPEALRDVEVEYLIVNEEGVTLIRTKETLAVSNQLSFLKSFYTQPNLKDGKYELIVRVPSRNLLAIGSSSFTISGKGNVILSPIGRVDYTVVFQTLLGVMGLFVLLTYFEFMRFLRLRRSIQTITDNKFKSFLT